MKISILKTISFGVSALIILISFQNCNQNYRFNQASEQQASDESDDSSVVQSASSADASRTPAAVTPVAQTQTPAVTQTPVGSQPPTSCFPSGYTIGTGSAQKYIYYRKCDNEIQLWRNQGQQQCCSKSVTITDVSAFYDEYCASLGSADTYRYEGTMVCN